MENINLLDNYISREQEIQQISGALEKYNHVIIQGVGGIGKSTLVRFYQKINPLNFSIIHFIRGIDLEIDKSKSILLNLPPIEKKDTLIIIDGYDEILSDKVKETILRLIREGRKYRIKLIITSRIQVIDKSIEKNAFKLNLTGFNKKQAREFVSKFLKNSRFDFAKLDSLFEQLDYSPLAIRLALSLIENQEISVDEIISLLHKKINYRNQIVDNYIAETKIVLPEPPKIISNVSIINNKLIDIVERNPNAIYSLSSRQFEELVAELFEEDGYKVTLTQETRDGGKDLFIVEDRILGNFLYYVECKKYALNNPVGVRVVRELYGTVAADRATAGVIVTSSYFSTPAIDFTEQIKNQMSLVDFHKLNKWITRIQ